MYWELYSCQRFWINGTRITSVVLWKLIGGIQRKSSFIKKNGMGHYLHQILFGIFDINNDINNNYCTYFIFFLRVLNTYIIIILQFPNKIQFQTCKIVSVISIHFWFSTKFYLNKRCMKIFKLVRGFKMVENRWFTPQT